MKFDDDGLNNNTKTHRGIFKKLTTRLRGKKFRGTMIRAELWHPKFFFAWYIKNEVQIDEKMYFYLKYI